MSKQTPRKTLRGKMISASGVDFIRKIDVFPKQLLDGDIKLVCKYDISPSSFHNTRLELMSNTYQLYRFIKCKISYTSLLPTAINGLFIGYIDTDPSDDSVINSIQNSTDVLRIARSHQGSVQGKIKDNWSFTMPIRDDDQFFFIGDDDGNSGSNNSSDKRLRKMGTLYIYQVGQATKFDGSPLTEELSAGALNIEWSCQFMNPQLQSLTRVYDGISEKDVYRVINDINWYREYSQTSVPGQVFQNTRFRHLTWTLNKELFQGNTGDYVILSLPIEFSTSKGIKSFNTFSLPYDQWEGTPYGMTTYDAVANAKLSLKEVNNFIQQAFQFGKGAISVAKQIYDVISLISSVFVLNLADVVDNATIDDTDDADITQANKNLPLGQNIVHYDGINSPIIEEYIEFQDNAHASRANYNTTIKKLFVAFKIKKGNSIDKNKPVKPSLPPLKKIDNS